MLGPVSIMLAAVAAAAPAGPPAPQANAPGPITVVGEAKKICHRQVSTGSVIPQKVCLTAQEQQQITDRSLWVKEQLLQQSDAEEHIRALHGGGNGP